MRSHQAGLVLAVIGACAGCSRAPATAPIDPDREQRVTFDQSDQDSRCAGPSKSIVYSGKEPPDLKVWGGELPQPVGGVVYNDKVAKRLGYEHLSSLYGTRALESSLPLQAKLHRGVWYVQGTLEEGATGGTLYIQICQSNGQVLNYYATQ